MGKHKQEPFDPKKPWIRKDLTHDVHSTSSGRVGNSRVILHIYGWQFRKTQMKSAAEFRVVLPYPLAIKDIKRKMEQAFGDIK